jgi:cobalt-zinc-cadmium efflux system outer membrane protein
MELEYERSDIDLATVELLQPLDWQGKRAAGKQLAENQLSAVRAEYDALWEHLAGELLSALAEYQSHRAMVDLGVRQVALLERIADVARQRARAKDLDPLEVELAELAYVEGEIASASHQTALADALDALYRITGVTDAPKIALPQIPAEVLLRSNTLAELAMRHPEVRAARIHAKAASTAVRHADIDRRADPTIGLKGGLEDDETLVGLRFSFPLQVRNDFSAKVDAARSEAAEASHKAEQVERRILAQLSAARTSYQTLLRAWQIWERTGRGKLETRLKLLERLWRIGELSTTDYLVQVKQSLETESAGLTLQHKLRQGWIAWLRATGQVQAWLGSGNGGEEQ